MSLVVDTNVWIAGLVAEGLCREIVKQRLQGHDLITSMILFAELTDKLRVKFGMNPNEVPLIGAYREKAIIVDPIPLSKSVSRNPDDDWVLATAIAGNVDAILTGDKDLLVLESFQSIPILSPRQFIEKLEGLS